MSATDPTLLLAAHLRQLHAARTRHFTSPDGAQAYAIVATDERLGDLLAAADELDRVARFAMVQYVTIDGAGLDLLTYDHVREAARDTLGIEYAGITASDSKCHEAIRSMCKRLGVDL